MSHLEMQSKQNTEQSGVLVVEHNPSRPLTDSDEKNPTNQDVPGTLSDLPGSEKNNDKKSSKVDDKKKQSKSKSFLKPKNISSTKINKSESNSEKAGSIVNKENTPETVPMTPQDAMLKKPSAIPAQLSQITQPISPNFEGVATHDDISTKAKYIEEQADQDEKNSDKITELRTKLKHSEWSDDEEAGGLPRSESRSSRVSRAVRQFFCCGLRCEAPEDDYVSHERFEAI